MPERNDISGRQFAAARALLRIRASTRLVTRLTGNWMRAVIRAVEAKQGARRPGLKTRSAPLHDRARKSRQASAFFPTYRAAAKGVQLKFLCARKHGELATLEVTKVAIVAAEMMSEAA